MKRRLSRRLARPLTGSLLTLCLFTARAPLYAGTDGPSPGPSDASAAATGSWGDVNEDGLITAADAALLQTYIADKGSLTLAQAERIIRYGDIAGTINRTEIGNGAVNVHDAKRSVLLTGGIIDAGTAGPVAPGYGDVDSDNRVTIVDAVIVNRRRHGILPDAATLAKVDARGGGDISPTIPFITFGDGRITAEDVALVQQRANGAEPNPPAYVDYWPLHAPTEGYPDTLPDLYTFTDVNGFTGDALHRISFATQSAKEVDGYTVTDVTGTDGSLVGAFKGIDGSIYAKYIKYPQTFGDNLIEFGTPIKILDANAASGVGGEWHGRTSGYAVPLGVRPVVYTGTVLSKGPKYVPSAGAFPSGTPPSQWSSTVSIRLDVGLLPGPQSQVEMQQAFFFDFTPGIGIIGRGQASLMGSPAPTNDRVRLEQTSARVRGRNYSLNTPAP